MHGKLECLLNTVQACAIDVWPDLDCENFISYICKAYKGTAAVPACNAIQKGRKIKPFGFTKRSNSKLSTISSAISS
ncbi:hypothetical protein MTR67_029393 [Solanum verrucosum]|uniref:Uncharacterized protein n=1 Tax=Solanum verrucosum TaxID=315347 RepID=A0AAF0U0V3_SOLVR|nr:hypothetical protein MTR67_029393 [Solanum verrucosum]